MDYIIYINLIPTNDTSFNILLNIEDVDDIPYKNLFIHLARDHDDDIIDQEFYQFNEYDVIIDLKDNERFESYIKDISHDIIKHPGFDPDPFILNDINYQKLFY